MLAICLDIRGEAALTNFGGIASTPVVFFESSRFIHFFTRDSVTGEKSKFDTMAFDLNFHKSIPYPFMYLANIPISIKKPSRASTPESWKMIR